MQRKPSRQDKQNSNSVYVDSAKTLHESYRLLLNALLMVVDID